MDTVIRVQVRQVYGRDTIYPANPQAAAIARLAGTKTLTSEALRIAQSMGFTIEVEAPSVQLGDR